MRGRLQGITHGACIPYSIKRSQTIYRIVLSVEKNLWCLSGNFTNYDHSEQINQPRLFHFDYRNNFFIRLYYMGKGINLRKVRMTDGFQASCHLAKQIPPVYFMRRNSFWLSIRNVLEACSGKDSKHAHQKYEVIFLLLLIKPASNPAIPRSSCCSRCFVALL